MEALVEAEPDESRVVQGVPSAANSDAADRRATLSASFSEALDSSAPAQHDSHGRLSVRRSRPEDTEPIRALLKQHHGRTIFGHLPFSDAKFDRQAEAILKFPPHMVALTAEQRTTNGATSIVGFAWATLGTYVLSDEGLIATCHLIAVDNVVLAPVRRARTFLSLLKAMKAWSKARGAESVLVHITTGTKEGGIDAAAADRLLRKVGAEEVGGGYAV